MIKNHKVAIITSFNKELFLEYGLKFIESYSLPFDLILYSEKPFNVKAYTNHFKAEFIHENLYSDTEFKDFQFNFGPEKINTNTEHCTSDCDEFCFKHNQRLQTKKCLECEKYRHAHTGKCIKCSGGASEIVNITKKFSFKVFSMINAYNKYKNKYKYLIWIDGDSKILKSFDYEDIKNFTLRKDFMMAYLKRYFTYSECGFIIFNTLNEYIKEYFDKIRKLYLSGEVYSLPQTHDSWVWDYLRREFEKKGAFNFDLTNEWCKLNKITGNTDIISHSVVQEYIYHFKGKRKQLM